MSLTSGTRLGPFEVLAPLGAGGMGEVYKARDTRLNRDVAIKVLPERFALQADARARFEREARAIAGLNHPHICTIHDVGREGSTEYLVLELLDGETLADRLVRGPLAPKEALQYAEEIADALDKAHSHGIAHRDLKPGNIMLTKSGVKLLDFGLAKLQATGSGERAEAATSADLTMPGVVLGTPQYMAPEQITSGVADSRADIFAFGAVLHEMLTARKAFGADNLGGLANAIAHGTPAPVSTLVAAAVDGLSTASLRRLDRLIATCLAKDPDNRWQTSRDLRRALQWITDDAAEGERAGSPEPSLAATRPARQIRMRSAVAAAVVAGALVGAGVWLVTAHRTTSAPTPVLHASIVLPTGEEVLAGGATSLVLSPDAARLAYVSVRAAGARLLSVRDMRSGATTALPGTEGAAAPFFSPDGQWIGFFSGGKLRKVLASGGPTQSLCDAAAGLGGSWGVDGTIYFAPFNTAGLWKVAAVGGTPQPVTTLDRQHGETSHRWPQVLPGSAAVLFTVWTGPGWDEHELHVIDLTTGERHAILKGGTAGVYVPPGYVMYSRADVITVVSFDLATLRTTGPPVALEERALEDDGTHFSVSASGLLAYLPVSSQRYDRKLVWVDARGHVENVPAPPRPYVDPKVSADGRFAAVSIQGPVQTIWLYDFTRRTLTPLTNAAAGSSQAPVWTRDGKRIAYRGTRAGFRNLFWKAADGSDEEERLTTSDNLETPSSWSADGTQLIFVAVSPETSVDILSLPLSDRTPHAVLRTSAIERLPAVSPDGRWLAYISNESGAEEVYVRAFGQSGGKLQISTDGGTEPSWAPDGLQLFYRSRDRFLSASIAAHPALSAGNPTVLFTGRYRVTDTGGTPGYGVGPDGRLLMVQPPDPERPATEIDLVTNWFDELTRRVAAGPP